MVPAPNLKHQEVQGQLQIELGLFLRKQQLGRLFAAPCDVILSDNDVVQTRPSSSCPTNGNTC